MIDRTKRLKIDCSSPVVTDQSAKKMCDINNIMEQYRKTGLFPHVSKQVATYKDNTVIVPLEQAYEMLNEAKTLFYQLPAQVRKLMDNDPTKLNEFLSDPDNYEVLVKHKLIEPKAVKNNGEESSAFEPATAASVKKSKNSDSSEKTAAPAKKPLKVPEE